MQQQIVYHVPCLNYVELHVTPVDNNSSLLPLQTMQHFGKAALRITKNYTKGYSDTQAKVRDATSNDPWGPSGTQMNEIAQLTYNQLRVCGVSLGILTYCACRTDFIEIMEMLDKRLNDKGKNWRRVFKVHFSPETAIICEIYRGIYRVSLYLIIVSIKALRTSSSTLGTTSTSSKLSKNSST